MTPSEEIQAKLKCNDLTGALAACKAAIRKAPTDGELRFMLFQLLSLLADWEGASNQLVAYSELVGRQSPLPIIFNEVIQAEVRRKYIFQGEEPPTIFGEPPEWVPYLLQALTASARQQPDDAAALRQKALEEAPAVSGSIDGQPFSWIMDGDSRISILVAAVTSPGHPYGATDPGSRRHLGGRHSDTGQQLRNLGFYPCPLSRSTVLDE
jgi:type VI secretion system protein ImpE